MDPGTAKVLTTPKFGKMLDEAGPRINATDGREELSRQFRGHKKKQAPPRRRRLRKGIATFNCR